MEDKKLVFNTGLTDEELHERWSKLDWDNLFSQGMQELKWYMENVEKPKSAIIKDFEHQTVSSANDIGYSNFQDSRLEPPEPKELEKIDDSTEEIEVSLDKVIITVNEDGSWDYEDESYPWAANPDNRHGDWYSEDYNVYLDDTTGVVEKFDEIAEPFIPGYAGRYQISCDATLIYNVSGVEVDRDYFQDEDGDIVYDGEEVYTDDAEVEFDSRNSFISNFKYSEIE